MALPIITAIRALPFKQSVRNTLEELAHRASIYGVVRVSAKYMGEKCHHHPRTFQRHMVQAVEAHVVRKTVTKTVVDVRVGDRIEKRLRNEINTYTFILPWKRPSRTTPPNGNLPRTLPPPERKK